MAGAVSPRARRLPEIAILGGGVGGMSAAFELTSQPGWRERYSVTLYQLGWRLGGKGASGRGDNGRIEEHGLHVWFSAYTNALDMMQRCYRELDAMRTQGVLNFDSAFKPHDTLVVQEWVNGEWRPWEFHLGQESDTGWKPTPHDHFSAWVGLVNLLSWMHHTLACCRPEPTRPGHQPVHNAHQVVQTVDKTDPSRRSLAWDTPLRRRVLADVNAFSQHVQTNLANADQLSDDERRLNILFDLSAAIARGMLRDNLILRGFDAIDHLDLRDWLERHGAARISLLCAPVRALYDLGFSYPNGQAPATPDDRVGSFAAGVGLRSMLAIFAYRRPVFLEMQASMGETIFTPLYLVLKRRGVRFKFFQRVSGLHPSADGRRIERVDLTRQARLLSGHDDDYDPLVPVNGLACWPNAPRAEQLVEADQRLGATLESNWGPPGEPIPSLVAGRDFDTLVLGISLGALPALCSELTLVPGAAGRAWKQMLDQVKTVRTQAVQLWLQPDLAGLGWPTEPPILGAFAQPLDTWADMSHLIRREAWPAEAQPSTIAYLCGPMPDDPNEPAPFSDPQYPCTQTETVRQQALSFVEHDAPSLWPHSSWDSLVDPHNRQGAARLDSQYWRANIDPSERYVIAVPGSTWARLRPDNSGFDNLLLVGDWTRTELNCGTVESAVLSARHAVRRVVGARNLPILGPFHEPTGFESLARAVAHLRRVVLRWWRGVVAHG